MNKVCSSSSVRGGKKVKVFIDFSKGDVGQGTFYGSVFFRNRYISISRCRANRDRLRAGRIADTRTTYFSERFSFGVEGDVCTTL